MDVMLRVGDLELDGRWWGAHDAGSPAIVMLHEGLGSIAQWRDVPRDVHERSGLAVLAYNRRGYGTSTAAPEGFRPDFMHDEGRIVLPGVLAAAGVDDAILVGHSDGASISLIAAGSGAVSPRGICVIAPHIYVEDVCARGIRDIASRRDDIVDRLGRYHRDPHATFDAWNGVWLDPEFQSWDIQALLADIGCPVLAVQGDRDEYATDAMITGITSAVPNPLGGRLLPGCGHIAHRDRPDLVVDAVMELVTAVR